jgi:hypothetical protein
VIFPILSFSLVVSHCLLFPLMWIATLFVGCNSYPSRFAKSRAMLIMICASLSWVLSSAMSSAHDAKAAFDKVIHSHLFRRMYHAGIQNKTWTVIQSLHHNAESCIKWAGSTSDCFKDTRKKKNCRAKREFFFQNLTLGYMTKTLNQIIFYSSTKIRIFFPATLGIRIFF